MLIRDLRPPSSGKHSVSRYDGINPFFVLFRRRRAADKTSVRCYRMEMRAAQPGFDVLLSRGHVRWEGFNWRK